MGPPMVILSARSPRWTAGLGRALRERGLPVRRVSRPQDSLDVLAEAPGSAVVLEFDAVAQSWPAQIELIERLKHVDSGSLVVVIAPRGGETVELAAREAGAAYVWLPDSANGPIVEIVLRHLERSVRPPL